LTGSAPRICILSQRELEPTPVRAMTFEFEDLIGRIDRAEIVAPRHSPYSRNGRRLINRLGAHTPSIGAINPGFGRQPLQRTYDLFFAACLHPWDLLSLHAVPNWRSSCEKAICLIQEIWVEDVDRYAASLRTLDQFDHVFIEYFNSLDAVQKATRTPCSFLPPAVDTELFCPLPGDPPRFIDVYNLGRRSAETHDALVTAMERRELLYYYSTVPPDRVWNPREHRLLLANMMKRSRYSITHPAKFNEPSCSQHEIGFRYFEGAAAGTVLVGSAPDTAAFHEHFDWIDAVVPIGASGILPTIRELDADPDRVAQIRRNGVVNSLLRHDGAHRWEAMLRSIGLEMPPGLASRKLRLEGLAEQVDAADGRSA